jgi:hypothetical protein
MDGGTVSVLFVLLVRLLITHRCVCLLLFFNELFSRFPRLAQSLVDYEITLKRLAEDFAPYSRVSH